MSPLPDRARPPQVVLGVGAALLVVAATALASAYGGPLAHSVLLLAAGVGAAFSLSATGASLRSSAETLAATAAGLGFAATAASGTVLDGEPVTPLTLAGAFLALRVLAPETVTWPLASWVAAQLGVLRLLGHLPADVHTEVWLTVALLGLGVAVLGRRPVARVALISTAPWWLAGVVGGSADAWTGGPGSRWVSAALVVAAGLALLPARLHRELDPLLGPKEVAPVVAGLVSGVALTGVLSPIGIGALVAGGWAGVALPSAAAVVLTGWRRGLLLPVVVSGGSTLTALCVGRLVLARAWGPLSLLLLLMALPPVAVTLRRRGDRHVTVPVSVACLAGSVLLAVPADVLTLGSAAIVLAGIYTGAMALGSGLESDVRRPTAGTAALTGAAAAAAAAVPGERGVLVAVLTVQGLATLAWAWRTGRRAGADVVTAEPEDPVAGEVSAGWKAGAAQLVVAGWTAGALAGLHAVEAWTLPLAAGLLIAAGPRLLRGRSWPAWGPGLLVAAAPSTALAVLEAAGPRPVAVLLSAAAVLLAGGRAGVLAPLLVGGATAVVLVLGLAIPALPWPLAAALIAGLVLLAWGALREQRPVAGFRLRLADLR